MSSSVPLVSRHSRAVALWLLLCLALVAGMVLVGGYTRLSGSGLSITEWAPIHGVIPPLNAAEWQEEFDAYRASPQYAQINKGMSLDEFKAIFWPEYWHRVLGRVVGLAFFLPFVFFAARRSFSAAMCYRLLGIFLLGGLQGFMGWYMVKSGLVDDPYVSHVRLAMHLSLAFTIFAALLWSWLDVVRAGRTSASLSLPASLKRGYRLWFALLCVQIVFGALVAGLHAGLIYNTYPTMNGEWFPQELWEDADWWNNLALVQFIHRHLALGVVLGFIIWWFLSRAYAKNTLLGKVAGGVALVLICQFALGVLTLLHVVPLSLALAHQMTALLLFALAVAGLHALSWPEGVSQRGINPSYKAQAAARI